MTRSAIQSASKAIGITLMFVSFNGNTTDDTSGTGTAYLRVVHYAF